MTRVDLSPNLKTSGQFDNLFRRKSNLFLHECPHTYEEMKCANQKPRSIKENSGLKCEL